MHKAMGMSQGLATDMPHAGALHVLEEVSHVRYNM